MPSQQRRSAAAVNGSSPSAQTSTTTTQMEGSKNGCLRLISSEPAMLLFMCSAMAKFPVFQSLLYEKACLNSGRFGPQICQNISATHSDLALQKEANHLLLASSFCLLLPSIPIALLLGAMFDTWSSRKSQLIPLAGLLLADLNYMLQTIWPESSAYWLLLSDLFFGFAGGFTSIIGLLFAYSVRVTSPSFRSSRVAIMEGCMGLGGMCGYLLSGYLRQKFGYLWVFALLTAIHLVIFLYVLLFLRELVLPATDSQKRSLPPAVAVVNSQPADPEQAMLESASLNSSNQSTSTSSLPNLWSMCKNQISNVASIYTVERDPDKMKYLNIVLLALGIELISFSGLMDILFSFLRFQLKWTDREYGLFNGFGTGLASFCVIFFYPLLQKQGGISNLSLALFGLITKIVSVLMLTFSSSTLLAMLSIIPSAFGRFISSALRAMASACVGQNEQGKVFSLISLLEAVAFLVASLFFNGLYPYTLNLFPGLMLLLVALLLLLPVGLLLYMRLNGMTGSI